MLNNLSIIGRWSKDPEIIMANNGTEILNATIAVSDSFDKDNPLFIDVKAFKKTALNAHQFTQKGSKVGIVGKLQQERWEKDGQKRSKHVVIANQIVFLDEKPKENNQSNNQSIPASEGTPVDDNDSLPF